MTRGRRSSLAALEMKATLADRINTVASCAVIFVNSFILMAIEREKQKAA